jgi:hypothetical protein
VLLAGAGAGRTGFYTVSTLSFNQRFPLSYSSTIQLFNYSTTVHRFSAINPSRDPDTRPCSDSLEHARPTE